MTSFRNVLTVGYSHVLVPEDVDVVSLVGMLIQCEEVESHGYGDNQRFTSNGKRVRPEWLSVESSRITVSGSEEDMAAKVVDLERRLKESSERETRLIAAKKEAEERALCAERAVRKDEPCGCQEE